MAERKIRKGVLRNRIERCGIELEGAWLRPPDVVNHLGPWCVRDGSLHFPGLDGSPRAQVTSSALLGWTNLPSAEFPDLHYPPWIGEIPGPPGGLGMDEWEKWMRDRYPQFVNETCGLHVHMSFKYRLNYMRLMRPEFTTAIIAGLKDWGESEKLPATHPLWGRLNNPNHDHCAHTYLGDAQAQVPTKDFRSRGMPHSRYAALNYCWAQHQTLECRLLPMMEKADQAVSAVKAVFHITNTFLSHVKDREPRIEARIALSPPTESHYRITV